MAPVPPARAEALTVQRLLVAEPPRDWVIEPTRTWSVSTVSRYPEDHAMTAADSLHLERVLPAPRSRVFRMHAEPDLLARWWGPRGFSVPEVELDLRVGGAYRITMQPPEGEVFLLVGEFQEIEADRRLVYTFRWEPPDPDDRETLVTVAFGDVGTSTEMTVDQRGFATEARRSLHIEGWTESLDRLQEEL